MEPIAFLINLKTPKEFVGAERYFNRNPVELSQILKPVNSLKYQLVTLY